MGGVGVEGTASVVAKVLDRLLRGERTDRDRLRGALERVGDGVAGERLHGTLRREDQCRHEGDRDEDVDLSLIHISEPTRQAEISYAVFCLKKKKKKNK